MEIQEITTQMRDQLRSPLPKEALKPHPTKTFLTTIKPIFITERLNDVFGVGVWSIKTDLIERGNNGDVIVKVILTIPKYGVYYECFGGNNNGGENSKGFDLGDAFKGATTDGISKICSYMEIGIDVFKGKVSAPTASAKPYIPNQQKPIEAPKQPLQPSQEFNSVDTSKVEKAFEKFNYLQQVLPELKLLRESKTEWNDVTLCADIKTFALNVPKEMQLEIHKNLTAKQTK